MGLFVNFTVIFPSRPTQIQLTAMKQNSCPVVGEAAKPTGVGLDELDGAVEALGAGVADVVLAEVQQSGFMTPEHLDDLSDGLELTSHGIVGPRSEETFGSALVAVAPELSEVFLDAPSPAGLEVALVQGSKRDRLSTAPVGVPLEPRPFAAGQWRCARLGQPAVLLAPKTLRRFVWKQTMRCLVVVGPGGQVAQAACPHVHGALLS